jgi:hypothetical protein
VTVSPTYFRNRGPVPNFFKTRFQINSKMSITKMYLKPSSITFTVDILSQNKALRRYIAKSGTF